MKQEVLLTISGLHTVALADQDSREDDPIEVITPASYYRKNGKHYILYDELVDGFSGVIKNKIKITGDSCIEIMKSGITNSHMVFEKGKTNLSFYETPFGKMHIGVHTRDINVSEDEHMINANIEYGLNMNDEAVADCKIKMKIQPKSSANGILLRD